MKGMFIAVKLKSGAPLQRVIDLCELIQAEDTVEELALISASEQEKEV